MVSDPLEILRLLGEESRIDLYQELASATRPRTATELAQRLGCHVNTVRMQLDRLREAGVVEVEAIRTGTVGRPQHVYRLAADAPAVSFDPPAHALLGGLLAAVSERMGADPEDAAAVGRSWGAHAITRTRSETCVSALERSLDHLGFDPQVGHETDGDDTVSIAFLQCPFRELAEAYPELVCHLHRGICEGVVESAGDGNVSGFSTLYDPSPCEVTIRMR